MQAWLGFYDAGFVKIDRKGGPITTLIVDHAFVGLTGTIQPGILASVFNDEHFESGLSARILFAMPPTLKRSWNEDEVDEYTILAVRQTFEALYALPMTPDSNGKPSGKVLPLTVDAKKIWAAWHDELEEEISGIIDVDHPYALVLPKLRSAAARLALILQLVSHASNDQHAAGDHIDATSMARGVALARWFKHEQQRVYNLLYENKGHRQIRRMVALVTELGGSVSVRDWQRKRHLKTAAEAEAELQKLVDAGCGSFSYYQNPKGGRSVRSFGLCDTTTDSDSASGRSSVTIRTIDTEENPLSSNSIPTCRVTDVRPPGAFKNGCSVT
jgi:hypothetical protein